MIVVADAGKYSIDDTIIQPFLSVTGAGQRVPAV
jgi:hypothetical protein